MTTDFTSATILGTKNTTTEKLSFSTQKHIDKNNMFDSLLTNATKSYTSKDLTKSESNNFTSKEYAAKTKDINSAREHKNSAIEKENSIESFAENKPIQEKEITNKNTEEKLCDDSNVDVKTTDKESFKENISEKEDTIAEIKEQNRTETKEANENKETHKDTTSSKNEHQENNSENNTKDNQQNETSRQEAITENENIADDSNKILNEQILANVELVERLEIILTPEAQTTTPTDNKVVPAQQTENVTTEKTALKNELKVEVENIILNEGIENITSEKINTIQGKAIQEALKEITNQQPAQNIIVNEDLNILQNAEIDVNTNLIKNSMEKEQIIKDLSQQFVQNTTTQNSAVKTTQENLAADNARITLNLENNVAQEIKITQQQENATITPINTIEESTETQIPTIKVTEEVATQVEANFANLSQNKDYAGEIKSKAAAKLGELQGTSTIVTEVQTATQSNSQNQSQTNLGQNSNTSIQNNAAEQIAKLAVEDATNSADSFLSKLEARINGTSKTTNAQNTTLNKADIMSQMNAKFSEMQQAGQNKVSIILQPENLGKVSVEIMNSKDGIVAKMTTDNQQVKELFDKNIEALKASLSAQGVNVNNIKVECTNESSNNAMNFEREQFNQNFNNSSNNNHNQTQHSQNSETRYSTEYGAGEESTEELESTNEIKNTETIIKHNGKVDYKV